jgi:hypothetical protein
MQTACQNLGVSIANAKWSFAGSEPLLDPLQWVKEVTQRGVGGGCG